MIRSAIAFGVRAIGCLYVSYWAIFFGSAAFLIITFYLHEALCNVRDRSSAHKARLKPGSQSCTSDKSEVLRGRRARFVQTSQPAKTRFFPGLYCKVLKP